VSDRALVLEAATYRYAGSQAAALRGVSLRLERGRVLGVAGPNESGKTTLCLVASGLAPAVTGGRLEGSVRVDGQETATLPPHSLAQRCGVLFANPATALSGMAATVFEEIAFGPCNLGLPAAEVIDQRLLDEERVLCAGGDHTHSVLLDPRDIVAATDATVADISED